MRGLADAPLRRGKAERGAHRAIEEGVGLGRRRPDRFVEPGDEREIEGEQARFEQAENLQSRMRLAPGRRAQAGDDRVEQRGVVRKGAGEAQLRPFGPFVEEFAQRLAAVRLAPCFARRSALALREDVERGAMGGDEKAERRLCAESSERRGGGLSVAQQRFGGAPVVFVETLARVVGVAIARQ